MAAFSLASGAFQLHQEYANDDSRVVRAAWQLGHGLRARLQRRIHPRHSSANAFPTDADAGTAQQPRANQATQRRLMDMNPSRRLL